MKARTASKGLIAMVAIAALCMCGADAPLFEQHAPINLFGLVLLAVSAWAAVAIHR